MAGVSLHLLRHGAPETPGLMLGRTDAAPTAGGIAACVAQASGLEFEAIVSSDLRRASETAAAIGAATGHPIAIDPRWRELDFGDWDGLAAEQVDRAALGRFWDDPEAHAPPGGERWSALVARVAAALTALAQPTLVITHGGAMRAVLAGLFGYSQPQLWAFDLPYAALISIRLWPGEPPNAQIIGLRT